jgi:RsiW-degrading membrane proteinase PrsW (M82 family)
VQDEDAHAIAARQAAELLPAMPWAIVLIGTWVLLPWYHEDVPDSPQSILLSDPDTRQWHEFADVWKTHVAFMAPILATAAAALVVYYGRSLARDRTARNVVLMLLLGAFAVSSLAALIGSLVTRAAPLH